MFGECKKIWELLGLCQRVTYVYLQSTFNKKFDVLAIFFASFFGPHTVAYS